MSTSKHYMTCLRKQKHIALNNMLLCLTTFFPKFLYMTYSKMSCMYVKYVSINIILCCSTSYNPKEEKIK